MSRMTINYSSETFFLSYLLSSTNKNNQYNEMILKQWNLSEIEAGWDGS